MKIRLTKLSASASPYAPTPRMEDYNPGRDNGPVSVPVDYMVEGELLLAIAVGSGILLGRYNRNGIPAIGLFRSSPVRSINGDRIETLNSIYLLENLPD